MENKSKQKQNETIKKQKTKRKDSKSEKTKSKKPRPLKHEIGIEEPIESLDVLKALAQIRFEENGKVIIGGTKEHSDFLKKYCITGMNQIFRAIKKDEIAIVLIMKYKHLDGRTTSSFDLVSDLLKTCAVTKSFKIYSNDISQSEVQNILQVKYNPRMIGIRKSYVNESVLKELLN